MEKVLDAQTVVEWLRKCSKNGNTCQGCPYDDPDYEKGCGKLLADAAQLLAQAYPAKDQPS